MYRVRGSVCAGCGGLEREREIKSNLIAATQCNKR